MLGSILGSGKLGIAAAVAGTVAELFLSSEIGGFEGAVEQIGVLNRVSSGPVLPAQTNQESSSPISVAFGRPRTALAIFFM